MATLSSVNVKITGDTGQLVSSLTVAEKRVTSFASKVTTLGSKEARGLSNLARGFTNAAGQTGVLNSEISILASSMGNIGLAAATAGIGFGVLVGAIGGSIHAAIGFEAAITKVAKTAGFSKEETKAFGDQILEMSRRLPVATSALTEIAIVAGQLGIAGTTNIAKFVEEVAKLESTTGVVASELATSLGTLIQVSGLPIAAAGRISAALTELGNTSNSTERQILEFSTRLVGVTSALGIPIADLLGISSAFAAAGVDAERGGTAIQRVLIAIDSAAQKAGDELKLIADVAGQTTTEFKKLVDADPGIAFTKFIEGLKGIDNVIDVLEALEIADARLVAAALSVANSSESVSQSIQDSRRAALAGTATNVEFARSSETTAAKLQLLKNNLGATAVDIGNVFIPAVRYAVDSLNALLTLDASPAMRARLDEITESVEGVTGAARDAASGVRALNDALNEIPGGGPIQALTNFFQDMGVAVGFVADQLGRLPGVSVDTGTPGDIARPAPGSPIIGEWTRESGTILREPMAREIERMLNRVKSVAGKGGVPIPPGLQPKPSGPEPLTIAKALSDHVISLTEALTLGLSDAAVVALELADAQDTAEEAEFRRRIGLQALAQAFPGLTGQEAQFRLGLVAIAEHLRDTGQTIQQFIHDTATTALEGFKAAFSAIFEQPTRESLELDTRKAELELKRVLLLRTRPEDDPRVEAIDKQIKAIESEIGIRQLEMDVMEGHLRLRDRSLATDLELMSQATLLATAIEKTSIEVKKMEPIAFYQTMAMLNAGNAANGLADSLRDLNGAVGSVPGRASGGHAGGLTLVGERGPELVRLPGGSYVYPNDRLKGTAYPNDQSESGAGGNIAYITINSTGAQNDASADMLAKSVIRILRDELGMQTLAGPRLPAGAFSPRRA